MIITISDMWKNQQKMLDNDNQIKLSSLIVILDTGSRPTRVVRQAQGSAAPNSRYGVWDCGEL